MNYPQQAEEGDQGEMIPPISVHGKKGVGWKIEEDRKSGLLPGIKEALKPVKDESRPYYRQKKVGDTEVQLILNTSLPPRALNFVRQEEQEVNRKKSTYGEIVGNELESVHIR